MSEVNEWEQPDNINEQELLDKIDTDDFYQTATDTFTERRKAVSLEVRKWVGPGPGKVSFSDLERILDVAKPMSLRFYDRPFTMGPNQLAIFSLICKASCHEILFGHQKATMLSKNISEMLLLFRSLSVIEREEIISYISGMASTWKAYNGDYHQILSVDHVRLVRYRLQEAAHDRAENVYKIFPKKGRQFIAQYMLRDKFEASMNSLMMMALCLNTTIDQFCCVDYTGMTDLRLFNSDELIHDDTERRFVQKYLIAQYLDQENEAKIIQHIFLLHWSTKLMGKKFASLGLSLPDGMLLLYDMLCEYVSIRTKVLAELEKKKTIDTPNG